jgi:hypothetical protein
MNSTAQSESILSVAGKGDANRPEPDLFDPHLRTVVRYADPAAWTTAAAVARAIAPVRDILAAARDDVAVLAVSDDGPQETMQALEEAARKEFSSPLRFPAGNPGSFVGVSCILFGFRGPTLNFTLPPPEGASVALDLAAGWLKRRVVRYVVLSTCALRKNQGPVARSLLLTTEHRTGLPGSPLATTDADWLRSVGE